MMNDEARLAELFSLANKKDVYGALARRLADAQRPDERDISTYAGTLKPTTERNIDRDVMHYSYGL